MGRNYVNSQLWNTYETLGSFINVPLAPFEMAFSILAYIVFS